jgi:hypothetical protein
VACELPRRALLAGGGALFAAAALAGCSGSGPKDPAELREEAERAEHSPAARGLRRAAERDSAVLLARYDAVLAAHPSLAARLEPLRETVAAHLSVLREESGRSPDGEPDPGAAAPPPAVDPEPAAAVAALAAAELETSAARLAALPEAPPELARLLASLAAAGAVQDHLLSEVA